MWALPLITYLVLAACGPTTPTAAISPLPPIRAMQLTMSGELAGSYRVIYTSGITICGFHLSDDPKSIDYILNGHVEGASPDVGVSLEFAVHHYSKPGAFSVGQYPTGSSDSPAIASVVREITPRNIVSWVSDAGKLVIDPGDRSGTLDIHLNSTSGLGDLSIRGTWLCSNS